MIKQKITLACLAALTAVTGCSTTGHSKTNSSNYEYKQTSLSAVQSDINKKVVESAEDISRQLELLNKVQHQGAQAQYKVPMNQNLREITPSDVQLMAKEGRTTNNPAPDFNKTLPNEVQAVPIKHEPKAIPVAQPLAPQATQSFEAQRPAPQMIKEKRVIEKVVTVKGKHKKIRKVVTVEVPVEESKQRAQQMFNASQPANQEIDFVKMTEDRKNGGSTQPQIHNNLRVLAPESAVKAEQEAMRQAKLKEELARKDEQIQKLKAEIKEKEEVSRAMQLKAERQARIDAAKEAKIKREEKIAQLKEETMKRRAEEAAIREEKAQQAKQLREERIAKIKAEREEKIARIKAEREQAMAKRAEEQEKAKQMREEKAQQIKQAREEKIAKIKAQREEATLRRQAEESARQAKKELAKNNDIKDSMLSQQEKAQKEAMRLQTEMINTPTTNKDYISDVQKTYKGATVNEAGVEVNRSNVKNYTYGDIKQDAPVAKKGQKETKKLTIARDLNRSVSLKGNYRTTQLIAELARGSNYEFTLIGPDNAANQMKIGNDKEGYTGSILDTLINVGNSLGDKGEIKVDTVKRTITLEYK